MSRTLRAGVIGLGMMGRHHARILGSAIDGVELVAVADPLGDRYGVAGQVPLFQSIEELIGHGLDICVVAVPTEDHERVGLALADAGVHTLIEKPIANDTEQAVRLTEAFTAAGLVGTVGHVERYNPALQSLRRRLEAGELGEIFQISTRRQGPFPARIRDVGVTKDLATHDIDLTAWVGQSPYAMVSAQTAHKAGRPHEDMVLATGQLANGVITNHIVNWLTPYKERLTIVHGERGAFVADTAQMDLTFFANGDVATEWDAISRFRGVSEGDMTRYAIPKPEPLVVEHECFRDAVLGKQSADVVTFEDGARTLAVAEAVLASAGKDGRLITVAP